MKLSGGNFLNYSSSVQPPAFIWILPTSTKEKEAKKFGESRDLKKKIQTLIWQNKIIGKRFWASERNNSLMSELAASKKGSQKQDINMKYFQIWGQNRLWWKMPWAKQRATKHSDFAKNRSVKGKVHKTQSRNPPVSTQYPVGTPGLLWMGIFQNSSGNKLKD